MAEITLDDLLKETKIYPEKLDKCISDHHLREIALFLTSWRTVASHLDLDENDPDDAEQGGRKVKDKSLKALQIWKGKFGFRATYKKLVITCYGRCCRESMQPSERFVYLVILHIQLPVYVHTYTVSFQH